MTQLNGFREITINLRTGKYSFNFTICRRHCSEAWLASERTSQHLCVWFPQRRQPLHEMYKEGIRVYQAWRGDASDRQHAQRGDVFTDPIILPLDSEHLQYRTITTTNEAHVDISARGFWTMGYKVFLDMKDSPAGDFHSWSYCCPSGSWGASPACSIARHHHWARHLRRRTSVCEATLPRPIPSCVRDDRRCPSNDWKAARQKHSSHRHVFAHHSSYNQ